MIESVGPKDSFITNFWTVANYPGEAIERVLKACARMGIENAFASELDVCDLKSLPANVVHHQRLNVYRWLERHYFPSESSFRAPFGIIKAGDNGKYDYELIREGFYQRRVKTGIYEIEVVVADQRLFSTLIELVKRLPSIRVLWLKLAADWEDKSLEQFWTNEKLHTVRRIERFLTDHWSDTIANGHVAVTVYSDFGQTNLLIDTHKTIKVLTKNAKIQSRMAAALRRLQFKELRKFHSLEYGYHHWHFRPSRSKSRTRLVRMLKENGFTLRKENVVEPDE